MKLKKYYLFHVLFFISITAIFNVLLAQPELEAWGNLRGIRIDGQLMEFETSIHVVKLDWEKEIRTAKERQPRPIYQRDGDRQIVTTRIDSLYITNTVDNTGPGTALINVKIESTADSSLTGLFFCVAIPGNDYLNGKISLIDPSDLQLKENIPTGEGEILRMNSRGFRLTGTNRQLEVRLPETTYLIVRKVGHNIRIYLELAAGSVQAGQIIEKSYEITASGKINSEPVTMILDAANPGRKFDGIGGNFRLQNPETDPPVIDYCLENLRVAWARVEMPWYVWHPSDTLDPVEQAEKGNLNPRVKNAMEMAQRLHEMGIPVMLAAWFPPRWAVKGEMSFRPQPGGLRGNALDPAKTDMIYESITDYILYMKKHYGVEMVYFSFNESDLGINVRQTDDEHTTLIKGLGAYFKSKGLKTKLLLGDTADANGWAFINDAMNDPEAQEYMGAVSFHSWRGWDYETLKIWALAAQKMDIPLIVGEGSIDAAAWRYPGIFEEPVYAMEEINLYVRIMDICQPLTILQWQLTADYSPLAGGGVFGNDDEPLHPTQRFFNLKQLGSTKKGLPHLPMECVAEDISCAALGSGKDYAFHIVNNGPTREVTLKGLPSKIKSLEVYVTDENRNMEQLELVKVINGEVKFNLDEVSFTSLMTK